MTHTQQELTRGGSLWPLWGVVAGAAGIIANMVTFPQITDDDRGTGVAVLQLLESSRYHFGVIAGIIAVFSVLALAAGWRRWLMAKAPDSLAGGMAPLALVASAGTMLVAYGIKGMLAIYLPGGLDETSYPLESLYTLYILDDMVPFLSWWGVAMAAGALAWVSLKERHLPIWFGLISAVFFIGPAIVLAIFALPGFPGIVTPGYMLVTSLGLAFSLYRSSQRTVRQSMVAATA